MTRLPITFVAVLLSLTTLGFCQTAWHSDLAYPGGGYWPTRAPIAVENTTDTDLAGAPARVTIGGGEGHVSLAGPPPVESIRVCDERGQEMLYEVTDADGMPKRRGDLAEGDTIIFPVEVPANSAVTYFIYGTNPEAWAPPEYFGAGFANGGFEKGADAPAVWRAWGVDAQHRMTWQTGGARTDNHCARCEVDVGTEPTWVKYMQGPIPVIPGGKYRFSAWVKGENVVGNAGWYIHVDGDKPQVINQSGAWNGTFDWREVVIEFEVPPDGQVFSCGTILRGTGKAWYDDAKFERLGGESVKLTVGENENRFLDRVMANPGQWNADQAWQWRTPVMVRNFTDADSEAVLVTVNMHRPRTLLAKHAGWRYDLPVRIIDPDSLDEPLPCAWADGKLLTVTGVPARSEKVLMVYWSTGKNPPGASDTLGIADWAASDLNLARNGSMEDGDGGTAEEWASGEEGREGEGRFSVTRVEGGVHGDWRLQLRVPPETENVGWVGSRQQAPAKPNARYLLAGHIKGEDIASNARIHGHFQKQDGSLSDFDPFFSTAPQIAGDTDWTLTSAQVTTPPDCAFIEIHLTMNSTGTLWHDAIVLLEADTGVVGPIESRATPDVRAESLTVWPVNPMVKVFPDDCYPGGDRKVDLYACRNEREPFQLALRTGSGAKVTVRASKLDGPGGASLSPPDVYGVGYVPIDHPMGYASSQQPSYHRLKPTNPGSDGWAGDWPDPLIPLTDGTFMVGLNRTRSLWLDVSVPADATPGDYSGKIELVVGDRLEASIPVRLTVWPLTLPERKSCRAIYDLRSGPRGNILAGGDQWEMIESWYRLLAEYDVSPGLIYPRPEYKREDGKVVVDYSEFDWACELLFDELNCNVAYTPWFFYSFGWGYSPKSYFGFEAFTPEWTDIFQGSLREFYDHMAERGWSEYFIHYVSDEPDRSSEEVHANLARVCDLAREAVPDVLVYSSTWAHIKGLDDSLNLWGIGPQGTFPADEIERRREAGDRFWYTTDGQMCIDTPYLGIERMLPWFCFKYDVEAYEFWGVSWWTYDPWEYGWHKYIRQSHEGEVYRWVRYPNGDGYLTYPGEPLGQTEPLPSIRLMAAREGVEDYEIFLELSRRAGDNPAAHRALDNVRALVETPNKGGRYSTDIMPNPDAVLRARIAAGQALAKLMK